MSFYLIGKNVRFTDNIMFLIFLILILGNFIKTLSVGGGNLKIFVLKCRKKG